MKLKEIKQRPEWERYFAWHPVRIDNELVWLEWVEHKAEPWCCGDCGGTSHYYRFPNKWSSGDTTASGGASR